jgi:hypothetical protein
MDAGSGTPDNTYVVHHRTDELLAKQHAVSDGQATCPVKEGTEHAQSLSRLSSYLVVCRPGKPSVKRYPEISCRFYPRYWLSEKMNWPVSLYAYASVLSGTLIEILQSRTQCFRLQR